MRQFLVDVSIIARRDAGTGVQRVVRSLLREIGRNPPRGFVVKPVRATRWRAYRYVSPPGRVRVQAGDVFLGLDLAAPMLPYHLKQVAGWRKAGVKTAFVVYDLLPVLRPEWFTSRAARNYERWIRAVASLADHAVCISRSVADELAAWLEQHAPEAHISVTWFHLGADLPAGAAAADAPLGTNPSVLMVGTLEPRKGYELALAAFEQLWQNGTRANLVIVGRPGWKTGALERRLRAHPEAQRRLFWMDSADDAMLHSAYAACAGLLVASEAEGFGLPLIEAAQYGKPILVRDLPVFREVAGKHATYFSAVGAAELAAAIAAWLAALRTGGAVDSKGLKRLSWAESASVLLQRLDLQPRQP